jgi:hypothetical protein
MNTTTTIDVSESVQDCEDIRDAKVMVATNQDLDFQSAYAVVRATRILNKSLGCAELKDALLSDTNEVELAARFDMTVEQVRYCRSSLTTPPLRHITGPRTNYSVQAIVAAALANAVAVQCNSGLGFMTYSIQPTTELSAPSIPAPRKCNHRLRGPQSRDRWS